MKKIALFFVASIFALGSYAQEAYVDVGFGYSFGFPGVILGQDEKVDLLMMSPTAKTSENIVGSFGKGFNGRVSGGYMFNKYIGVEASLEFFAGSKILTDQITRSNVDTVWNLDIENFSSSKSFAKINQARLIPSVVFSTDTVKGISGYAKLGMLLPVYGKGVASVNEVNSHINAQGEILRDRINIESKITGKIALGFKGAIGLKYNIKPNISVFGELFVSSVNGNHNKRTITSYKVNEVEKIDNFKEYQKTIEFVDKLDGSSNNAAYNNTIDVDAPRHELNRKSHLTQMGIQVGVRFSF